MKTFMVSFPFLIILGVKFLKRFVKLGLPFFGIVLGFRLLWNSIMCCPSVVESLNLLTDASCWPSLFTVGLLDAPIYILFFWVVLSWQLLHVN